MDKPTHHDVDVILKLYELRREDRMRKARGWLAGYKAGTAEEHRAACPPGSDQDSYFRMVTSYWDMAAAFVTSEAVNKGTVPAKRGRTAVRLAEDQGNHRRRTEGYGQSQVSFQPGDRGVSPD